MAENLPPTFNSGLRIKKPKEPEPPSEANHPEHFINNPGFMRPAFNSGLRIKKPFEEELPGCSQTLIDKLIKQLKEKNLTNWKVMISKTKNLCYFFNTETKVSQWTFPTNNGLTVPEVKNSTCGPLGCVIMGGSKRRTLHKNKKKNKKKTIKYRK